MLQKNYKKQLGSQGEKIAARYYKQQGFKIIKQNFSTRYGELDLVLEKNRQILVVEVKTRRNYLFGYGEEAVDDQKFNKINKTYQILQRRLKLSNDYDIEICIVQLNKKEVKIRCFRL